MWKKLLAHSNVLPTVSSNSKEFGWKLQKMGRKNFGRGSHHSLCIKGRMLLERHIVLPCQYDLSVFLISLSPSLFLSLSLSLSLSLFFLPDTTVYFPFFNGTSYLELQSLTSLLQSDILGATSSPTRESTVTLYLTVKTRASNGIILYGEY